MEVDGPAYTPLDDAAAPGDEGGADDDPWDYCIVFPHDPAETAPRWREWLRAIAAAELEARAFFSVQNDEVYVKLRAPRAVLARWAERLRFELPLDPAKLRELHAASYAPGAAPTIPNKQTRYNPFKYHYGRFRPELDARGLYAPAAGGRSGPFSATHRARIVARVLLARRAHGGAELDLPREVCSGAAPRPRAFFALHDADALARLARAWVWARALPHRLDAREVRSYLGMQWGFFFAFRQHVVTMLTPVAAWGAVVSAVTAALGDRTNWWTASLALAVALWGILTLEMWKSVEASRALEWGAVWEPSVAVAALPASGRAGALQERSAYVGVQQQHRARGEQRELSVVDGRPVNWSKSIVARRRRRAMQHVAPLLTMLVAFVAALIVVILLKQRLGDDARDGKVSAAVATGAPSAVSCVAVQVLNIAYKHLAVFLTDRENWRTEVEYERQLVVKMSAFQLVNSFGALCASPC